MNNKIVLLNSYPFVSVEFPKEITNRSCEGELRIYPHLPKPITDDELAYIKDKFPDIFYRLNVKPYIESKRVDKRGITETDIHRLAEHEGIAHLPLKKQIATLERRGKIEKSIPDTLVEEPAIENTYENEAVIDTE